MAVDATAFYVNQTELDARIDTLVTDITAEIDALALLLDEDSTTHFVSITDGKHSEFTRDMRTLESKFRWYKDLSGMDKVFELKGAFASDYSNSAKECFILDKVFVANP
jgi:hypothetical protein